MASPKRDHSVDDVLARMADQLTHMADQLAEQQAEMEQLRHQLGAPPARLAMATPATMTTPTEDVATAPIEEMSVDEARDVEMPGDDADRPARPSRRRLLKLAGAGAAAAAAVGAVSLAKAPTAAAAGVPLNVDEVNTGQLVTSLTNPNSATIDLSGGSAPSLLDLDASATTSWTDGTTTYPWGLDGLDAYSGSGAWGVYAAGDQVGVYGVSSSGYGVIGASSTGIDLTALGSGRLWQIYWGVDGNQNPLVGPPTSGTYLQGEQVRDGNGDLWLCIQGSPDPNPNNNPGTWVRVVYAQPGYTGGAINLLSAPIRIFDSRSGTPAPLPASKHILAGNSTTTIQVTGTTVGGLKVPAGARAVVGNLTLTNPQGGGDLILYPHGVARPLTSNSNYAKGQTVANFAIVALSAGGAMDLYVHGASTNVLFDVAGFIM